jgi:hypothetical protein
MTTKTTKEQVEAALSSLQEAIKENGELPKWVKKIWVDQDDHGFALSVKVDKGFSSKVPRDSQGVKVCIFSVG